MKYTIISLTFIIYLTSIYSTVLSAQSNCDPSLANLSPGALGYQDRGDRCEGLYIKEVGSTTLQVVSLTESFGPYNTNSAKPLTIEWDKPPGNSNVHLRAQGLKRKLYYRMDASRPGGSMSYNWPVNILASLDILRGDIGVTGTYHYTAGQLQKDVYIPLRITQEGKAIKTGSYNLVVLPGVEMKEVFISIAPLEPDGRQGEFIKDGEKLGYGYYPAERGIEIPISGLNNAGIYYLEIGAELRSGGTSTVEIWFYHSKS